MRAVFHLLTAATLALLPVSLYSASAADSTQPEWETRLRGDVIALLGEVHDNQTQQQLRFEILKRAISDGLKKAG